MRIGIVSNVACPSGKFAGYETAIRRWDFIQTIGASLAGLTV